MTLRKEAKSMEVKVIKREERLKEKIKVAAYCRVSTELDEQESSIQNQIDHYRELIQNNPDYEFVEVFYDQGISGYKEKRPGFQKMMKAAREGKLDLIITKSITRFARNTDTVLKATRELKEKGIGVFFELQNINTLTQAGELLMTVYAAFAQGESETYSSLARMTFKRKFSEGKPEYQLHRTLGFTLNENYEVEVVPEEAKWVKQIYKWVKENYSTSTIVKMAAENGITLKSGKPFGPQWVYKTIRNVAYKGDYVMQSTYTDAERKVHVNQTIVPSYYIENDHPAIVSKSLWDAANKVIDDRARERRLSERGKELYKLRKEKVERSFADSKQNHGFRYAMYKGIEKNQNYTWLICAAQNMKNISKKLTNVAA